MPVLFRRHSTQLGLCVYAVTVTTFRLGARRLMQFTMTVFTRTTTSTLTFRQSGQHFDTVCWSVQVASRIGTMTSSCRAFTDTNVLLIETDETRVSTRINDTTRILNVSTILAPCRYEVSVNCCRLFLIQRNTKNPVVKLKQLTFDTGHICQTSSFSSYIQNYGASTENISHFT